MHIGSFFENASLFAVQSMEYGHSEKGQRPTLFSGHQDTVSISEEARAASLARKTDMGGDMEESPGLPNSITGQATEEFYTYMAKKRSKAVSGGSPEEKLEELYDKLESLQNQLRQVAEDEDGGTGNVALQYSIQSQISSVMSEISELVVRLAAAMKKS